MNELGLLLAKSFLFRRVAGVAGRTRPHRVSPHADDGEGASTLRKGNTLITKDLQAERSEQARVSAEAFLTAVASLTRNWPNRFGRAKYDKFLEDVSNAVDFLIRETKG